MASEGFLTTHILDTARGCPAAGVRIELFRLTDETRTAMTTAITNHDGRTDTPLVAKGALETGRYELCFHIGDYFADFSPQQDHRFLDIVPVQFGIDDATSHYHVPLLASPFGFSTYRGS